MAGQHSLALSLCTGYLPLLLYTKIMALLVLTLGLMAMTVVRQSDSHPLRTDVVELTELLAMLRAAGSVARPGDEEAALAESYPGYEGLLSDAEKLSKRDLPRLGVSIFRSSPSRVTDSRAYKDTGRCRVSYLHA